MPARLSSGPLPIWDDYRFFLATCEAGSFSKAAINLEVAQSTLSRRIDHLEEQLGVRLFVRLPTKGVTLTPEGESILDTARQIQSKILEIQSRMLGYDTRMEGPVRISVTDGLAGFWIIPQLAKFQEEHTGVAIEFQCSIEPADARALETDLSIRYQRPEAADLILTKLGSLHFVAWASPEYVEKYGRPTAKEDLLRHRLLEHRSYIYDAGAGEWAEWFDLADAAGTKVFHTNSTATLVSAIRNGVGIGLLPTYACECVEGIIPLNVDLRTRSDIWLTYHPNLQGNARVRAVRSWLKCLFDSVAWPWFQDEFHPPRFPTNSIAMTENGYSRTF